MGCGEPLQTPAPSRLGTDRCSCTILLTGAWPSRLQHRTCITFYVHFPVSTGDAWEQGPSACPHSTTSQRYIQGPSKSHRLLPCFSPPVSAQQPLQLRVPSFQVKAAETQPAALQKACRLPPPPGCPPCSARSQCAWFNFGANWWAGIHPSPAARSLQGQWDHLLLWSPSTSHGSSLSSVSSLASLLADASDPAPWGQGSGSELSATALGYKLGSPAQGSPAQCSPTFLLVALPHPTPCSQGSCRELGCSGRRASVRGDARVPRGCRELNMGPQAGLAWLQHHRGGGRGHLPSPLCAGIASAPSAGPPDPPEHPMPCTSPACRAGKWDAATGKFRAKFSAEAN